MIPVVDLSEEPCVSDVMCQTYDKTDNNEFTEVQPLSRHTIMSLEILKHINTMFQPA